MTDTLKQYYLTNQRLWWPRLYLCIIIIVFKSLVRKEENASSVHHRFTQKLILFSEHFLPQTSRNPRRQCGFRYNSSDEDNFSQPTLFWRSVLKSDEKERMVDNIVRHLKNAARFIQVMALIPQFIHKGAKGLSYTALDDRMI